MIRLHILVAVSLVGSLACSGTPTGSSSPHDGGMLDASLDAGIDAGVDAGLDAGADAGTAPEVDAGPVTGTDAGVDAGADTGTDAGVDAGLDAGVDAGLDGGTDGGSQCPPGFIQSGDTCTNPCNTNNGGCDPNATCSVGGAGPVCSCNPGFTGNGMMCTAADPMVQMEQAALKTIAGAFAKFYADTGFWPLANTSWDATCTYEEPGPFTQFDTALFSKISGMMAEACSDAPASPSSWMGPYIMDGKASMADEKDPWGNGLLFSYFPCNTMSGNCGAGGDPQAPYGAIVIWSTGPKGIDETGCTATANGQDPLCLLNYDALAVGQTSDMNGQTDDIVVVVGAAEPVDGGM